MFDAYVTRGLSLREVAAEAGCALRTVARWMDAHGIERRSPLVPARPGEITYASEHACVHCSRRAQEWAYDHNDPDERVNPPDARDRGPFSLKVEHYLPLCKSCHRRFDYRRRQALSVIQAAQSPGVQVRSGCGDASPTCS
jgi:hypothetical protein